MLVLNGSSVIFMHRCNFWWSQISSLLPPVFPVLCHQNLLLLLPIESFLPPLSLLLLRFSPSFHPLLVFSTACPASRSVSPYLFGICSVKSEDLRRNSVNLHSYNDPDPPFFYFTTIFSSQHFLRWSFCCMIVTYIKSTRVLLYSSISIVRLFKHQPL